MATMASGKKWYDRYTNTVFYIDNFDGMESVSPKTEDRKMRFIAERIATQGGISYKPYSSFPPPYHPASPLPSAWLAWNKNPQCPPKIWTNEKYAKKRSEPALIFPISPISGIPTLECAYKLEGLAIQRHNAVDHTLNNINYLTLSFSMKNSIDIGSGFWLIDANEADFVYAILKSSMFKAWCELTAHTDGGKGHFTGGMWDIFPLPRLSPSQKSSIMIAGQELKMGWPWSQCELDRLIDGLFVPRILSPLLTEVDRKQILAEGFLDAFYGA